MDATNNNENDRRDAEAREQIEAMLNGPIADLIRQARAEQARNRQDQGSDDQTAARDHTLDRAKAEKLAEALTGAIKGLANAAEEASRDRRGLLKAQRVHIRMLKETRAHAKDLITTMRKEHAAELEAARTALESARRARNNLRDGLQRTDEEHANARRAFDQELSRLLAANAELRRDLDGTVAELTKARAELAEAQRELLRASTSFAELAGQSAELNAALDSIDRRADDELAPVAVGEAEASAAEQFYARVMAPSDVKGDPFDDSDEGPRGERD